MRFETALHVILCFLLLQKGVSRGEVLLRVYIPSVLYETPFTLKFYKHKYILVDSHHERTTINHMLSNTGEIYLINTQYGLLFMIVFREHEDDIVIKIQIK